MKAAKFNPVPENPGMAISFDPEKVSAMSRKELGESSLATALGFGMEINDATKSKWLDALHEESKRVSPPVSAEPETKKK